MLFRKLKPEEISCKVKQIDDRSGRIVALILLYKDARVDMNILDETVGPYNWEDTYSVLKENLYCTVSLYDKDKASWVSKSNVGTESNTEAEKGEASDAFKRACTNWGIGRELYTAPPIWITLADEETYKSKAGNISSKARFDVSDIGYSESGDIIRLVVTDGKTSRFTFGSQQKSKPKPEIPKVEKPEPPKPDPAKEPLGWIAKAVYTSKDGYKHLMSIAPAETVKAELLKVGASGWDKIDYDQYSKVFITLNSTPENFRDDMEAAQK